MSDSDSDYEEFASKFEIVVDEDAEDRGDLLESIARLFISMAEASQSKQK